MLGRETSPVGEMLVGLFGENLVHDLRNALATAPASSRPVPMPDRSLPNGRRMDFSVHRHAGYVFIEMEPADLTTMPLHLASGLIRFVRASTVRRKLLRQTTALLRNVLGYDRVMIYRFEHDGAGKVESEARRHDLESFLGQYFPASDIPRQARALYLKNPIRIISDTRGQSVAIEPVFDAAGEPLDLSHAHLRSVSPVHLEYLRNMGVSASMSISIIVDGVLWGLIACHHYSPKILSLPQRMAAEMLGEFFSMHLVSLEQKQKLALVTDARRALDRFLRRAGSDTDVLNLLTGALPDFSGVLPSDGVGVYLGGAWRPHGVAPPDEAIPDLCAFIASVCEERIWSTHRLSDIYPAAADYYGDVSGVLAVPLSSASSGMLLFFRKERLQTLNWAGDPDKHYETGPLGDRLTPRSSFAIWKQTVERQSAVWMPAELEIAAAIQSAAVEVALRQNELMQAERRQSELRQRLLNEELNHRVKNILSVIKSLVAAPAKDAQDLQSYITSLKGRIQALSFAHDQVIRSGGGGELQMLLDAELSPYRGDNVRIVLRGPGIQLDGRAYAVSALVFHELCTNAAKYGALSRPGGLIEVAWRLAADGDLEIVWIERGGPPVTVPERRGFGTALIERSIPFDLGGHSSLSYAPEGLTATMTIPGRFLAASDISGKEEEDMGATGGISSDFDPSVLSVLLVEDQILIAMDAESMLEEEGFRTIVTASSNCKAMEALKGFKPDLAVLDINLGSETSVPVAEELMRRGIPFLFATGYNDRAALPETLLPVPVVRKPYERDQLMKVLRSLVGH